mmetsp:Transcript_66099/g.196722  ORF Transcript_66099/g.196722 Transcript_66099/m.196722 type:complete len:361 (+) Transcript_66099:360-1442(+)
MLHNPREPDHIPGYHSFCIARPPPCPRPCCPSPALGRAEPRSWGIVVSPRRQAGRSPPVGLRCPCRESPPRQHCLAPQCRRQVRPPCRRSWPRHRWPSWSGRCCRFHLRCRHGRKSPRLSCVSRSHHLRPRPGSGQGGPGPGPPHRRGRGGRRASATLAAAGGGRAASSARCSARANRRPLGEASQKPPWPGRARAQLCGSGTPGPASAPAAGRPRRCGRGAPAAEGRGAHRKWSAGPRVQCRSRPPTSGCALAAGAWCCPRRRAPSTRQSSPRWPPWPAARSAPSRASACLCSRRRRDRQPCAASRTTAQTPARWPPTCTQMPRRSTATAGQPTRAQRRHKHCQPAVAGNTGKPSPAIR